MLCTDKVHLLNDGHIWGAESHKHLSYCLRPFSSIWLIKLEYKLFGYLALIDQAQANSVDEDQPASVGNNPTRVYTFAAVSIIFFIKLALFFVLVINYCSMIRVCLTWPIRYLELVSDWTLLCGNHGHLTDKDWLANVSQRISRLMLYVCVDKQYYIYLRFISSIWTNHTHQMVQCVQFIC